MKVLIDRNVERHAITHNTVVVSRETNWGNRKGTIQIIERRRVPVEKGFIANELPYLATLGEMARNRRLQLFTSFELNEERMRQTNPRDGYCSFSLLAGVSLPMLDPPISRPIVMTFWPGESVGTTRSEQRAFFNSITAPRYLAIKEALSNSHIDDAFHLWAAEVAGMDVFLTFDRRFARHVAQNMTRLASPVAVLAPSELCNRMAEGPSDVEAIAARFPPLS